MKGTRNKTLRKLLCSGLTTAMVLFNSIAVFAIEDAPGDQNNDESTLIELNNQEELQEQPASSSETAGPATLMFRRYGSSASEMAEHLLQI